MGEVAVGQGALGSLFRKPNWTPALPTCVYFAGMVSPRLLRAALGALMDPHETVHRSASTGLRGLPEPLLELLDVGIPRLVVQALVVALRLLRPAGAPADRADLCPAGALT